MGKYTDLVNTILNAYYPIPFILFTNCRNPLTVLGVNKEGYYFFSPYFIVKNSLLNNSCIELIVLEPVGTDGCPVEYPENFYSLQTTESYIVVSTECLSGIETLSNKFINRKLIDPCPKGC